MNRPQPRILFAGDDRAARMGLAAYLREEGYRVDVAMDGEEALAICRNAVPDLLMTDLDVPEVRGKELIEQIRQQYPTVELAVMTGETMLDAGRCAVALGVRHCFRKPIELDHLGFRIRKMIDANDAVWGTPPS